MDYADFQTLVDLIEIAMFVFMIWAVLAHIKALRGIEDTLDKSRLESSSSIQHLASILNRAPHATKIPASSQACVLSAKINRLANGSTSINIFPHQSNYDPAEVLATVVTSEVVTVIHRAGGYRIMWGDSGLDVLTCADLRKKSEP